MRSRFLPLVLLAPIAMLVPACGGGGGGGAEPVAPMGAVTLAATDAPSDQIDLFEVDLLSVRLVSTDGAVVEALPRTTRVDFADLVALSDLLTTVTVPAGAYRRFEVRIDPATAAVHIDGATGLATLLDRDGNPFAGPVAVGVDLPGDKPLAVTPGVPRFVELDFDLDASTVVDAGANTVQLGPVLYARPEPSEPKPIRAFGRLVSTDASVPSFTFERLERREMGRGREHEVLVNAETRYDVDGTLGRGAAGFALLAAKPEGARLEIRGLFDPARRRLLATAVQAGRGVFDGTRDMVEGVVLARSGGAGTDATLTVRGMGVDRGTSRSFDTTFTVSASFANTKVVRFADDAGADLDAVNVGQRITAFGTLSSTALDATSPTDGLVRLLETVVTGLASGAPASGALTIDLRRVEWRPVSAFTFSIDGTAVANPAAFQIGIGTMALPGVVAGSAVAARGFFPRVDAPALAPDFRALSVENRTATRSLLLARWVPPQAAPFAAADATGLTIDLTVATGAKVDIGGIVLVDLMAGADPQIVPAPLGGEFAIRQAGGVTLFDDFGEWLAEVQARLADATTPVGAAELAAEGRWTPATATLTAGRIVLALK